MYANIKQMFTNNSLSLHNFTHRQRPDPKESYVDYPKERYMHYSKESHVLEKMVRLWMYSNFKIIYYNYDNYTTHFQDGDLLLHPVVGSLLRWKWLRYIALFYLINYGLYLIYIIFLTTFALNVPNPQLPACTWNNTLVQYSGTDYIQSLMYVMFYKGIFISV